MDYGELHWMCPAAGLSTSIGWCDEKQPLPNFVHISGHKITLNRWSAKHTQASPQWIIRGDWTEEKVDGGWAARVEKSDPESNYHHHLFLFLLRPATRYWFGVCPSSLCWWVKSWQQMEAVTVQMTLDSQVGIYTANSPHSNILQLPQRTTRGSGSSSRFPGCCRIIQQM